MKFLIQHKKTIVIAIAVTIVLFLAYDFYVSRKGGNSIIFVPQIN